MSTVNYYRYLCTTENKFVFKWDTEAPNKCPNNNTHIIESSSISILNSVSNKNVYIQNLTGSTGGQYRCESKAFTIPANQTVSEDYVWPFDISVKSVSFNTCSDQTGDFIKSLIAPNTIIGGIISNANISDNQIIVSPTVVAYAQIGHLIGLTNGVNYEGVGEVLSLAGNVLTLTQPLTTFFGAGAYVQMTVKNIDMIIGYPGFVIMEAKGSTSSLIPTGTVVRAQYTNNSNIEKKFYFNIELFY